jgi:hypothetical protein
MRLFDTTAILVLTVSIVIGAITTCLTLAAGGNYPTALIAGGATAWAVLTALPRLIK